MKERQIPWAQLLRRGILLTLGALLVAVGLEIFLVPNKIIDGGVVGLSIIAAHLSQLPIAVFLVLFNLPFLWLGYKQIGKTFAFSTLYAVAVMSVFVTLFHPVPVLTSDLLLAAVFGGVILGLGVGIIIRTGGSLDGTEIVAIVLARGVPFSVGEIVMFFNIFILASAGFVFGWDHAMYSLIAYFVAFKAIDLAIEGLDESKSVTIVTSEADAICQALLHRLGRGVTEIPARGGYSGEKKAMLFCVVTRLEVAKLKSIVTDHDPGAFVVVENVHDVLGGRTAKRAIH
ncbi:MAG TPA: YitT family protein [Symbiobacteriaceae bacterium]|nr:YitT family protein [Symbiobacteriaceae bacterium]